jgi:Ca2+-binding EF-hand superfamily protein
VITQLLELRNRRTRSHEDPELYKQLLKNNIISQNDVIASTEKLLKREGINFHKEDYEAFAAYLNYDTNGNITLDRVNYFVFEEPEQQARDRFERRARHEAPNVQKQEQIEGVDEATALKSLQKIWDCKMNAETSELFKELDTDHDGYISKQ